VTLPALGRVGAEAGKITEYGVQRTDLKGRWQRLSEKGNRGPGRMRGGHKRLEAAAQFEAD